MKNARKKRNKFKLNKKIIIKALVIIILLYIIYGIYNLIKKPTNIVMIEEGSISSEENCAGYIIRNETLIIGENYKNGMEQIKTEGEKVAKSEAIFRYYGKNEETLQKKISELDLKIQEILESENNLLNSDIKLLDKQIEYKLDDIYLTNEIQKITEYKKDIDTAINKKAKIAGELSPSGSYLKELINQRSSLSAELNSGSEEIVSPVSGVVSYRIDGLEEVLTTSDFSKLNKDFLNNLNLKTGEVIGTNEEGGKIIDNFKCYIAVVFNSKEAKEATLGQKVKIHLSNDNQIEAKVDYIAEQEEGQRLIIFKITNNIEDLINYRKISLNIIWWDFSGLKVPNSAITYENDLAYVYRNRAGYIDKILVKILKSNENYSIVANYTTSELKELGYNSTEIKAIKSINIYDEIKLDKT